MFRGGQLRTERRRTLTFACGMGRPTSVACTRCWAPSMPTWRRCSRSSLRTSATTAQWCPAPLCATPRPLSSAAAPWAKLLVMLVLLRVRERPVTGPAIAPLATRLAAGCTPPLVSQPGSWLRGHHDRAINLSMLPSHSPTPPSGSGQPGRRRSWCSACDPRHASRRWWCHRWRLTKHAS